MRPVSLWFAIVALSISQGSGAQESAKPTPASTREAATAKRGDDAKAIGELVNSFTRAFDAGDADAAALTYAEDALVVDGSERIEGRAAIRDRLAASIADSPGNTIAIEVSSLRFLGPDTALEEGKTTIRPAKSGEVAEVTRFTVVYIKRDGHWLQSAVRDEAVVADLNPHDRLKELEWLVGDWINESQDAVVHTTCKWTDDGNFLTRDFTMKTRGLPVLSGSQKIGWDPVRGQFKTWIFDTEGGSGEGYWSRNGDEWVIKAEGVRQDGRHASVTNILKRLSKDRASWQSVDRTLGDVAMPGIEEVILVRKPPEAGK
ncbi:SgcJ/EcaC family oxidoreductase [Isosphaeraceae bacterium EP7]